jgi:hypothetical protein
MLAPVREDPRRSHAAGYRWLGIEIEFPHKPGNRKPGIVLDTDARMGAESAFPAGDRQPFVLKLRPGRLRLIPSLAAQLQQAKVMLL